MRGKLLLSLLLAACAGRPATAADSVSVPPAFEVRADELTGREHAQWRQHLAELPAPCADAGPSLAACVDARGACALCAPASRFVADQVLHGRSPAQVEAAYRARFDAASRREVPIGASPVKGAEGAAVTLVEFADFSCGACAATAPLVDSRVDRYPGQVQVVFKFYPLPTHPGSDQMAAAAWAAHQQGAFWKMHDLLFLTGARDPSDLVALAGVLELDGERFAADMASPAAAEQIEADRALANELGLTGTPMLWINGRHFDYKLFSPLDDLDPWLEAEVFSVTKRFPTVVEGTFGNWPSWLPPDSPLRPPAPAGPGGAVL